MIFSEDRGELRSMYAEAWRKQQAREPITALEAQIAAVVAEHPEYLGAVTGDLETDYSIADGKTNPFLHMGLHLGVREQVATNRPGGIRAIYEKLVSDAGSPHAAEHRMIDCLAEALWDAQRNNSAPDEAAYLEHLRALLR